MVLTVIEPAASQRRIERRADPVLSRRAPYGLIGVLILIALVNGIEAAQTLLDASAQYALTVSYSPVVRVAASVFWMTLCLRSAYELIRRSAHAIVRSALLLTAYGGWGVLWLILFARSDYDRGRIVFQAAMTVLLLIPVWVTGWRNRVGRSQ